MLCRPADEIPLFAAFIGNQGTSSRYPRAEESFHRLKFRCSHFPDEIRKFLFPRPVSPDKQPPEENELTSFSLVPSIFAYRLHPPKDKNLRRTNNNRHHLAVLPSAHLWPLFSANRKITLTIMHADPRPAQYIKDTVFSPRILILHHLCSSLYRLPAADRSEVLLYTFDRHIFSRCQILFSHTEKFFTFPSEHLSVLCAGRRVLCETIVQFRILFLQNKSL